MRRAFSVLLLLCGGPAAAAAAVEATGFNPPIPDGPLKPTSRPKRDKHAKFWETARAAERDERRKHTGRKKKVRPSTDSKGSGAESGAADPLEVPDATASNADRGALRAAANEAKKKARTAARAEKLEIAKAKRAAAKRESDDMHASWCDDATHAGSVLCKNWAAQVNGDKGSGDAHDVDEFWAMHESWCAAGHSATAPCRKWESKVKRETQRASKRQVAPL